MQQPLTTTDHSRDSAGMRYVYPVISRRAGGVSIGINLNTNNACNWRCIYCQVPGLLRGAPEPVDVALVLDELTRFLEEAMNGDFMVARVPEGMRRLSDIALSGNGEPTLCREFPQVLEAVRDALGRRGLLGALPLRVISNGSGVERKGILESLRSIAPDSGEVWFKIDAVGSSATKAINGVALRSETVLRRLARCSTACPTWIQTCVFSRGGIPSLEGGGLEEYLSMLRAASSLPVKGVHLYTVARPPTLPEGRDVLASSEAHLSAVAEQIREAGLTVRVSP